MIVQHELTEVDSENKTATCSRCGRVQVHVRDPLKVGVGRWRCARIRTKSNQHRHRRDKCYCRLKKSCEHYPLGYGKTRFLRAKYGLTAEQYMAMIEAQDGKCKICRRVPTVFHVDHDHKTNVVRGLLCYSCNYAIGHLQDSPEIVLRAYAYLKGKL